MKTIAASPTFGGRHGVATYRIVLRYRHRDGAFVTHKQFLYEDGSTTFGSGNYFAWPPAANGVPDNTPFDRAYADWMKRCEQEGSRCLAPVGRWSVIHEDEL